MTSMFHKYKVIATQGQGTVQVAEFNSLEDALAFVDGHQAEASFGIVYPDGTLHNWNKPIRE